MKFRMMEWVADAGGAPWTNFGKDHEIAIGTWDRKTPYRIIHPFRAEEGSST